MVTDNQAYYAMIPAPVRYSANLTIAAKLLFAEISASCDERGRCVDASISYYSAFLNMPREKVIDLLSQLQANRYIRVKTPLAENDNFELAISMA